MDWTSGAVRQRLDRGDARFKQTQYEHFCRHLALQDGIGGRQAEENKGGTTHSRLGAFPKIELVVAARHPCLGIGVAGADGIPELSLCGTTS